MLALADGMGGHAAGEVASSLAIAELAPLNDANAGADLVAELRDGIARANSAIAGRVAEDPEVAGMGTTLTAMLFHHGKVAIAQVGDSRAYVFRDGSLSQITKDETLVQSLVDAGEVSLEEARTHPQRSVVLRAMTGSDLDPSLEIREARAGDRYLICSDGLTDFVTPEALAEALRIPRPESCTERLVRLAMLADSHDNVTCIVADVVDGESGYDIPLVTGAAGHEGVLIRP